MRRSFIASSISFVVTLSSNGWAVPENAFQFTWTLGNGAQTCPPREKVALEVAAKLQRNPFEDNAPRAIRGHIEWSSGEWVVHVDQFDGDRIVDTRDGSITTPDCAATLATSVFLVTRLIETGPNESVPPAMTPAPNLPTPNLPTPNLPTPNLSVLSSPAPPPQPVITQSKTLPVATTVPRRQTIRSLDGSVFVGGGLGVGLLPETAGVISVGGGIGRGIFEASTGMMFLPGVDISKGIFSFGMTAGWLGGCVRTATTKRVTFVGCADLLVGTVHSIVNDIEGFSATRPETRAWAGASLTPRWRLSLYGPLNVEMGTHIILAFIRRRYTVDGLELYLQPPVAAVPFIQASMSFF